MGLSIILAALAAEAQVPAAAPERLEQECGLAGAVSSSRELPDVLVVRRAGGPGPMEPMDCLERWVNGRQLPVAIVNNGDVFADGWMPVADIQAPRPSGILIEGEREAVAAARSEAERLGLPVKSWRDTNRPAAILVGTRMPAAELAAKVRSGALGRLELGHYSIWEPDPEVKVEVLSSPLPFEMIFTGPPSAMADLQDELRRDGWTVVASAAEGATVFVEARILLEGLDMPPVLEKLGTGAYAGIRSAFVTPRIGFVGNEAE